MVSNSGASSSRSRSSSARRIAIAAALSEALRGCDDGAESTETLLRRHRRSPSGTLLAHIVERQRPAVEAIASSLASRLPRSVDVQDLVHAGLWGLMQAIDSYEPARCDQFSAFMRIRVRGAMLDELRHLDFLPRLFRRRVRECNEARARLRMDLEREPTGTEVAAALGITEHALLRRNEPLVLRSPATDDGGEDQYAQLADPGLESPIDAITRRELIELVRTNLAPMEWKVLQLHYLEGLTGKQVARRLRLSASRICQIHGRVLDRLKEKLAMA